MKVIDNRMVATAKKAGPKHTETPETGDTVIPYEVTVLLSRTMGNTGYGRDGLIASTAILTNSANAGTSSAIAHRSINALNVGLI